MKFYFLINEAIQALRGNALRSLLTIVGIVVGIFSVTTMLALGEGLSSNISDRFDSFISGDITVNGQISLDDLAWIESQSYVAEVLATQTVQEVTAIIYGSDLIPTVSTAFGDYAAVKSSEVVAGTLFDFADPEFSESVVVIDEGFKERAEEETGRPIDVGDSLTLGGQRYVIVGIIEGGGGGFGRQSDGTLLIPYPNAVGVVTNTKLFSSVGVNLVDQSYYEIAGQALLEGLNASRYATRDSDEYFSVSSAQDAIEAVLETTTMISLFLGVVGGIALFVGGIGTMNMMLTTVTERTKEIGLRKAIGARDGDILAQILAESVMLTVIGGVIGIALTYGLSAFANQVLAGGEGLAGIISIKMSNTVVMYATLVSFVVGVVFGIYPARNAAKLQPVDALRSE